MKPLVSVIIPAYNMAEFTVKTVMSLLDQTYPSVEIVVVDDGSTDGTGKALSRFADRITYINQENRGACAARNRGYQASNGDLVAFLDCDDLYHPEKLEKFVDFFEIFPRVGMVYSPEYLIDEYDRIIGMNAPPVPRTGDIFLHLLKGNFIGSSTPVIRRRVLDGVGLWDEKIFTTADWDLWLRVSRGHDTAYIDRPMSYSRQVSRYNRRNMVRTKREAYYVLDKFRRSGVPGCVLRESKGNVDLLLHRYAFLNGNHMESIGHLLDAITAQPIRIKVYILLLLSLFLRPLYRLLLGWKTSHRIDRQGHAEGSFVSWVKT